MPNETRKGKMANRYPPGMVRHYATQMERHYGLPRELIDNSQILVYLYLHGYLPGTQAFQILELYFCSIQKKKTIQMNQGAADALPLLHRSAFSWLTMKLTAFHQRVNRVQNEMFRRKMSAGSQVDVRSVLLQAQAGLLLDYEMLLDDIAAGTTNQRNLAKNRVRDVLVRQAEINPAFVLNGEPGNSIRKYFSWGFGTDHLPENEICSLLMPGTAKCCRQKKIDQNKIMYWRQNNRGITPFQKLLFHTEDPLHRIGFYLCYRFGVTLHELERVAPGDVDLRRQTLRLQGQERGLHRKIAFSYEEKRVVQSLFSGQRFSAKEAIGQYRKALRNARMEHISFRSLNGAGKAHARASIDSLKQNILAKELIYD